MPQQSGPAARLPKLIPHVSQPDPGTGREIPRHRARLSRLTATAMHPPPSPFKYTFDRPRRYRRSFPRSEGHHQIFDLHSGLRLARRLPSRDAPSRTHPGHHHPKRQRLRGGAITHSGPSSCIPSGRTGTPRPKAKAASLVSLESTKYQYFRALQKSRKHQSRCVEARSGRPRPSRQRRHPARARLRLPSEPSALSRNGTNTSGTTSRRCWPSGARTIRSSRRRALKPFAVRRTRYGNPLPRHRPLRSRRRRRRDCLADSRLPRTQGRKPELQARRKERAGDRRPCTSLHISSMSA
jgi:hypothetical protein